MPETKSNPYTGLPESAFWKSAVSTKNPFEMKGLWDPKFQILPKQKVATFGSCFAQNIGRALRARGFNWFISENAPPRLSPESMTLFNYDLFSCRTGNIYTTSLLNQWVRWALGETAVPDEYWESNGRFFDPFRPVVEPGGFETLDEMRASRDHTIAAFRVAMTEAKVFVFTLGLTESWFNKSHGYEYPMCPGTAAGTFDPTEHVFKNQDFPFIRANLHQAFAKIRSVNPGVRFLVTVSPVPLTATYSNRHVLVATMESKSVLRAVAGHICSDRPGTDYFPSYEIFSSPVFGGVLYEANKRSVSKFGVNFAMDTFFAAQEAKFGAARPRQGPARGGGKRPGPRKAEGVGRADAKPQNEDVVCEEMLLEAFGPR